MLASFWNNVIESFSENGSSAKTLVSILRQVEPIELKSGVLTISCENSGARIFLESKRREIVEVIENVAKEKISVEFVTAQVKKKRLSEAPLLGFVPQLRDVLVRSGLNAQYSFENFAVSNSNKVAYATADSVSKNPGHLYNPLFFWGGVGVGKTHLAQSIARAMLEANSERKVVFATSESFMNELIEAIRERSTPKFRRKFRNLDILIIDDIQFLTGKQTVQEEFFHTFNTIVSAGGQVVLTSDRPPNQIKDIEDRLRSRFAGGMIIDIQPPDFELKTAILLIKAQVKNIEIDIEAAKVIAESVEDVRSLEGTLLSVYAHAHAHNENSRIDLAAVDGFFSRQNPSGSPTKRATVQTVVRAVCSYYDVRPNILRGSSRIESVALARQVCMYILRETLGVTLTKVADELKRKDHTTIIHGVEKVRSLLMKNTAFKEDVDAIIKSLF